VDIQAIVNFISGVGFPIFMCILVFNKMNDSDKMHKEEVNTLKETIAQNTTVLAQLKQLLEDKFND
jgi:large-conductance mechanosensitive channel